MPTKTPDAPARRTQEDLHERGFKIVKVESGPPAGYKLVPFNQDDRRGGDPGRWHGYLTGPPNATVAHPATRGGYRKTPLKGSPFRSRVEAAHALVDALEDD